MTAPTPRTTAGRLLLMAGLTFQSGRRLADYPQMIVDIEEQAAAMAARASLLEAIENLLDFLEPHPALEDEQSAHEMMEQARAALAAPAGYRGRGANRNNPSLPVAAALDHTEAAAIAAAYDADGAGESA